MDDRRKSRLIILGVCGLSLFAIGGVWMYSQNSKTETAETEAIPPVPGSPQTIAAKPTGPDLTPAAPGTTTAIPQTPAGSASTATAIAPQNNKAETAPAEPAKPVTATAAPASTPAAAARPVTAGQPAASTIPGTTTKPVPSTQPVTATQPARTTAAPQVATTAPSAPVKTAGTSTKSELPSFPGAGTKIATATQPAVSQAPVTAPAVSTPAASAPPPKDKFPATRRTEATAAAKEVAGREDPTAGTFEKTPYPAPWTKAGAAAVEEDSKDNADKGNNVKIPPPPPTADNVTAKSEKSHKTSGKEVPIPPPPPSGLTAKGSDAGSTAQLPIDELPQPPDKPMVTQKLKLIAILGNKAMFAVPAELRQQNKWPATICVGPGEPYSYGDSANGSFSVVSVDRDSVTIEEEQERSVKSLPQIK
jgi:hypothetical protein